MAKQRGPVFIEGTIDGRTYYKRDGKYYVRKKSSLSARRVKRSPAFKRTMEYAGWMAAASVIASVIYWRLPAKEKKRKRYQAITGEAMRLLRDGMDEATVRAKLEAAHLQQAAACNMEVKPVACEADLKLAHTDTDLKQEICNAGRELHEILPTVTGTALVMEEELTAVNASQESFAGSPVSTTGQQRNMSASKGRSIAIIPTPAASTRRPRVLRYKGGQPSLKNTPTGRKRRPSAHDRRIQNNAYIE